MEKTELPTCKWSLMLLGSRLIRSSVSAMARFLW